MAKAPTLGGPRSGRSLTAVLGAVAAAGLISLTGGSEGVSLTPYSDRLAGQLDTVCFGETHVQMRRYTLQECKGMLADSLAGYAEAVRSITPGFDALTDGQKVAAVDFAYNGGINLYAGSLMRKRYIARDFPHACEAYLEYRYTNHGKIDCAIAANKCGGIMRRRQRERAACLGE